MTAPPLDWLVTRPVAHRGLHDFSKRIIENTSSAFAAAIAGGYAIECDVQLTADGEAVVFHDETLERLTGGEGWVKEVTAHEMQKLTIHRSSDRVQTLSELLDQVDGKVLLLIELKSHWDGNDALVKRAVEILQNYSGRHALMSFDPDMVEALRLLSPTTTRGIVADRGIDEYYNFLPLDRRLELRNFSHVPRTQPHFVSFYFGDLPFAPVAGLHQAGTPVISWTIRSPEEAGMALRHSNQITFEGYQP